MSKPAVYLHIGLSKSGTTYLQQALWDSRSALRGEGVLFPGEQSASQRQAVWDLLGRRLRGVHQPHLAGAWRRLVEEVTAWPGPKVIISEEFLVHARPRHVRTLQRHLAGHDLHLVVTVRDLERTLRSMWQQELVLGHAWRLSEYVAAVRDPGAGPTTAGVRFWLRFDLPRILSTWQRIVPDDHVHVVVVPPSGAPAEQLAAGFAEAVGVDPQVLDLPDEPANTSMGAVEAELLRRLNAGLRGRLDERSRHYLVQRVIRPSLPASAPVRLSDEDSAWIRQHALAHAEFLSASGFHVVGDPTHLVPRTGVPLDRTADTVGEEDVATCAITALQAVMVDHAKHRAKRARRAARIASPRTRLASGVRALAFGARFGVLAAADGNRAASRAAVLYLRRLSAPRRARQAGLRSLRPSRPHPG